MPAINTQKTKPARWLVRRMRGFTAWGWLFVLAMGLAANGVAAETIRPNILWIVSEDHGPHIGCYGDKFATTPNVDKLAAKGMLYLHAWSCAPVCAPARTTLITGMYAPSMGGEHMRSFVRYPAGKRMFPQYLREAGYYCSNNAKEDYNIDKPGGVWNESSKKAHLKNRAPGQPFFAVFNSEKSHESKLRIRPHKQVHDPAKVRIPAYHPDTPEVREDWAQYYDTVTEADADAGARLRELEEAGLTEDTIIFYYADHGSGMPRNKRWPYNCGLQVPLVVYIPEKYKELRPPEYRAGGKSERLVSFVDFAPTVLSLAGVKPPEWMQGHAFLGKFMAPSQPFVYGFRGRMDERNDLVRSVTDGRFVYIRNYMPHLIYGQHINYMFQTPTTRVWKQLHDAGRLNPVQDAFWQPKPPEELYDLQSDPDEVRNLAALDSFREIKAGLRRAQQNLASQIRDLGFLPEGERFSRAGEMAPYDAGHDSTIYPYERIAKTAELAAMLEPGAVPALKTALSDDDAAVRYWAAMGLLMRGGPAVLAAKAELTSALKDKSPDVRITAAQALGMYGKMADLELVLPLLVDDADWSRHGVFTSMAALGSLDALGAKASSVSQSLIKLPNDGPAPHQRYKEYVPRQLEDLGERFK